MSMPCAAAAGKARRRKRAPALESAIRRTIDLVDIDQVDTALDHFTRTSFMMRPATFQSWT
jgi:hypothetical protein